jgi:glycosyltransferase involved in cell wall biosynthesis
LSRLRLAGARFLRLLKGEIVEIGRFVAIRVGLHAQGKIIAHKVGLIPRERIFCAAIPEQQTIPISHKNRVVSQEKPIIFASACVGRKDKGDWKYCGGIKELNILVKLLRLKGYEAYMVTYDGTYEPWLIDHQPHISIDDFRTRLREIKNTRCVTSFAIADTFIKECHDIYFWDMELCVTEHSHFPALAKLYRKKIKSVGAISRTIQAWHMANFERKCTVIPNLLDTSLWYPIDSSKIPLRIGYLEEGSHTAKYIEMIEEQLQACGIEPDFKLMQGNEAEILSGMRTCEVFLSMNIGKDSLWGEGCPRTTIEALSVGCVVIAFDLIGNREILIDNFNGFIVSKDRPDLMGRKLIHLFETPFEMQRVRDNSLSILAACHTLEDRWPLIKDFLEL